MHPERPCFLGWNGEGCGHTRSRAGHQGEQCSCLARVGWSCVRPYKECGQPCWSVIGVSGQPDGAEIHLGRW